MKFYSQRIEFNQAFDVAKEKNNHIKTMASLPEENVRN
jgi:hypothetical protein